MNPVLIEEETKRSLRIAGGPDFHLGRWTIMIGLNYWNSLVPDVTREVCDLRLRNRISGGTTPFQWREGIFDFGTYVERSKHASVLSGRESPDCASWRRLTPTTGWGC